MWRHLLVLLYLVGILYHSSEGKKKKAKSVTTVLDSKWEQSPLVLEIAEYLAEESPEIFWQFVDGLSAIEIPLVGLGSDKAVYDRAIAEAGRSISPAQLSLLKLAVSLHVYSPRVEMYHQMAVERGIKCPAAVDVAGKVVCVPDQLQDAVKAALAKFLIRTVVNSNFKTEMQRNQKMFAATLNLQPSDTALFLNGVFFDMDLVDTMTVLDSLRQELRVMEGLYASDLQS